MTVVLSLGGRDFPCKPSLPGWQLVKLASAANNDLGLWAAYHDFFVAVLEPDQVTPFLKHMDQADDVDLADIEKAFADVIGGYAARPTGKSTSSPAGSTPTPDSSRVVDLSRGTSRAS